MNLLREKLRCTPMGAALRKGSSNDESQTTENVDRRAALQDAVQVTEGSTANVTMVSQAADADALKAVAGMGSDVLGKVGGAIVDLNRDSVAAQTKSFDSLVTAGASMVDKIIEANTAATSKVVAAYKPVDGANGDVAKWGVAAAAAGAIALVLLKGK